MTVNSFSLKLSSVIYDTFFYYFTSSYTSTALTELHMRDLCLTFTVSLWIITAKRVQESS